MASPRHHELCNLATAVPDLGHLPVLGMPGAYCKHGLAYNSMWSKSVLLTMGPLFYVNKCGPYCKCGKIQGARKNFEALCASFE